MAYVQQCAAGELPSTMVAGDREKTQRRVASHGASSQCKICFLARLRGVRERGRLRSGHLGPQKNPVDKS